MCFLPIHLPTCSLRTASSKLRIKISDTGFVRELLLLLVTIALWPAVLCLVSRYFGHVVSRLSW